MKQETTTTTTTTTTPTATPTATTPETTTAPATKYCRSRKSLLTLEQRNATARKDAKKATTDALLKLYHDDHLRAISECSFKANRDETARLATFDYIAEIVNSDDSVTTETKTGEITFDFFFFAPKGNRTTARATVEKVGRTATATADDPTRADGEKHLSDTREIIRLAGFGNIADSVNPDTVSRAMRDARYTTARGNRQFSEKLFFLSLFGWIVSTARQTPTDSAYARQQDEKARLREQRKKEQDAKREQAKRDREQAKKNSAKQPAKKATAKKATPAK